MYSRLNHYSDSDDEHADIVAPGGQQPDAHQHRSTSLPALTHHNDDTFGLFTSPALAETPSSSHAGHVNQTDHSPSSQQSTNTAALADSADDHDGATADSRELLLYAIPLYYCDKDPLEGLCFLPVSTFMEEVNYDGMAGGLKKRIHAMQDQVDSTWAKFKAAQPGTFKNKVYEVGHHVANDQSAAERLTRNIPKNVSKVSVYHPRQVPPDKVMERVHRVSSTSTTWNTAKAVAATLLLPVAWGIDVLILPGPSVLTWYMGHQVYKNASSAVGGQRLEQYLARGGANNVRVNYIGDGRLDAYWTEVQEAHGHVLDEDSCEQLVADIKQPDLLEPLLELRKRWLAETKHATRGGMGPSGPEYHSIRASESSHF